MADPTPSAASSRAPGGAGRPGAPTGSGGKILGLPAPLLIGGVAVLAALGYMWWRHRQSSSSSTATTSATRTSTTSSTDYSGELAELQAEIDQLMGQQSGGSTGAGGSTTTTKTTKTTKTSGSGGSGAPGPVSDLTVTPKTATSVVVSWRPPQFASHAPTATTYMLQIRGKDPAAHNIGSRTSYNVGGLRADTTYTAVVAAVGGPSSSREFTTGHTAVKK